MAYTWGVCQAKNPEKLVWGETGPRLIAEAVRNLSLEKYKKPYRVFCPLSFSEWRKVLEPDFDPVFDETTHAIHLWNEMWRADAQNKNHQYHPGCFYEQLKRKYLN